MYRYGLLILCSITILSCWDKPKSIGVVDAYKPIYGNSAELKVISQKPAQPIVSGGKIAKSGQILYQVEEGKGIHIIDLSNPSIPVNKSFISIPLCNEVTLKSNFLYSNNGIDLVVLNVSNINAVTLSTRLENAFPSPTVYFPPQTGVYFECPDPSKGIVIGWELTKINNPKCSR